MPTALPLDVESPVATSIEWAAGFFDGEGSISLVGWNEHRYRRLLVAIKQSEEADRPGTPDVLLRFAEAVKVGRIGGPYADRATRRGFSAKRRPYFMWYATDEPAEAALEAMWPHLGPVKRRQAVDVRERVRAFNAAVVKP